MPCEAYIGTATATVSAKVTAPYTRPSAAGGAELGEQDPASTRLGEVGGQDRAVPVLAGG